MSIILRHFRTGTTFHDISCRHERFHEMPRFNTPRDIDGYIYEEMAVADKRPPFFLFTLRRARALLLRRQTPAGAMQYQPATSEMDAKWPDVDGDADYAAPGPVPPYAERDAAQRY